MTVDTSLFSKEQLEAVSDTALEVVKGLGADVQGDLVDAWIAGGNVAAVARLAREDDAPAPARKAARRGLNVLKSRGILPPEHTTVVRPLATTNAAVLEARFSAPDPSGTSLYTFLAKIPGRDARMADVIVQDEVGVLKVTGGSTSGSRLRAWETDTKRRMGYAPAPVSLEWARARVEAARRQNVVSNFPAPLELDAYEDLLRPAAQEEPIHPILALDLSLTDEQIEERRQGSASLHYEPEFGGYLPSREAAQELIANLGQKLAATPNVEATEDADSRVQPLLEEEIAAATDRYFTPELRARIADRLLDGAISIWSRLGNLREERTRDVLAVRQLLLRAGLITSPPRDIPFLLFFFQKALAILAQQSAGRLQVPLPVSAGAPGTPSSGLVLSPGQLAAQAAAGAGETVTEGGIILPT